MKRGILVPVLSLTLAACAGDAPVDRESFAVPGCVDPVGLPDLTIKAAGPLLTTRLPLDERVEGRAAFRIANVGTCRATATIFIKPFLLAAPDGHGGHAHAAVGRVLPINKMQVDIGAGESTVFEWRGQLPRMDRRSWLMSAIVDSANALREGSELNNTATLEPIGYVEVTHSQITEEVGYDLYSHINGELTLSSGGVSHSLGLDVRPYPSLGSIASADVWARFMLADLDTGGVYSLIYSNGLFCMADSWCPAPLLCNEALEVCTADGTGSGEIVEKQWFALAWGMYLDDMGRTIGTDFYWQAPKFVDAAGVPFIPPGRYQFLTLMDSHDIINEFDEANNIDAVPFTLSLLERVGAPDTWFVKTPTAAAPAKLVEIKNSWVASTGYNVTIPATATWLSISPTTGTLAPNATTLLTFQVNTTGLAAGRYDAEVTVEATAVAGYSLSIPVTLWVYDAASGAPAITASPNVVDVSTTVGIHPAPVGINITNPGTQDLEWWAWMDVEWISLAPPDGSGPAGYSETADIFVHPEGIAPGGPYIGYVTIFHNAAGSPRTIQVRLTVTP